MNETLSGHRKAFWHTLAFTRTKFSRYLEKRCTTFLIKEDFKEKKNGRSAFQLLMNREILTK